MSLFLFLYFYIIVLDMISDQPLRPQSQIQGGQIVDKSQDQKIAQILKDLQFKLSERTREVQINLLTDNINRMNGIVVTFKKRTEDQVAKRKQAQEQMDKLTMQNIKLKEQIQSIKAKHTEDKKTQDLNTKLIENCQSLQRMVDQIKTKNSQLVKMQGEFQQNGKKREQQFIQLKQSNLIKQNQAEINKLKGDIQCKNKQIKQLGKQKDELKGKISSLQNNLNDKKNQILNERESLNEKYQNLIRQNSEYLKVKEKQINNQIQLTNQKLNALKQQNQKVKKQNVQLSKQKNDRFQSERIILGQKQQLDNKLQQCKNQLAFKQSRINKLLQGIASKQKQIQQLRAQKDNQIKQNQTKLANLQSKYTADYNKITESLKAEQSKKDKDRDAKLNSMQLIYNKQKTNLEKCLKDNQEKYNNLWKQFNQCKTEKSAIQQKNKVALNEVKNDRLRLTQILNKIIALIITNRQSFKQEDVPVKLEQKLRQLNKTAQTLNADLQAARQEKSSLQRQNQSTIQWINEQTNSLKDIKSISKLKFFNKPNQTNRVVKEISSFILKIQQFDQSVLAQLREKQLNITKVNKQLAQLETTLIIQKGITEEQKTKIQQYSNCAEEMKLKLNQKTHQYEIISNRQKININNLKQKLGVCQKTIIEYKAKVEELTTTISDTTIRASRDIARLQNQRKAERQRYERDIMVLKQDKGNLDKQIKLKSELVTNLQNDINFLNQKISEKDTKINLSEQQLKKINDKYRDLSKANQDIKNNTDSELQKLMDSNKRDLIQICHQLEAVFGSAPVSNSANDIVEFIRNCASLLSSGNTTLTVSPILEHYPKQRQFLVNTINQFQQRKVSSTLLWKYDDNNKNFNSYLPTSTNQFTFLVLVKSELGEIFGFISKGLGKTSSAIAFNLNRWKVFKNNSKTTATAADYAPSPYLTFGNKQVYIKSGSGMELKIPASGIGMKYFDFEKADLVGNQESKETIVLKALQIHRLGI